MDCHIQIFIDNRWQSAAVFEPDARTLERGIAGGGRLQYDIDYAVTYLGNRDAELIPGLTVGFELSRFAQWPPFLVDLLPAGAGSPPGNLRIAEAALTPPPDHFKFGFPRRDIIEQRERFLDYAEESHGPQ